MGSRENAPREPMHWWQLTGDVGRHSCWAHLQKPLFCLCGGGSLSPCIDDTVITHNVGRQPCQIKLKYGKKSKYLQYKLKYITPTIKIRQMYSNNRHNTSNMQQNTLDYARYTSKYATSRIHQSAIKYVNIHRMSSHMFPANFLDKCAVNGVTTRVNN